jgi:hypothetical protein
MDYVDVLIGFSAGACMIHLLDCMAQKGLIKRKWNVSCLVSGCPLDVFFPTVQHHRSLELLDYPTICVYGQKEFEERNTIMEMIHRYKNPIVIKHETGHEVPQHDGFFFELSEKLADLCESSRLK